MEKFRHLILILFFSLIMNSLIAQARYGFELRSGATLPTEKLGNADLDIGLCLEGVFELRLTNYFAPYIGWGWNRFTGAESSSNANVRFEETGFLFGLGFYIPIDKSKSGYFVKLGGVYNFINTKSDAPVFTDVFGNGLGWQVGMGLNISLGDNSNWSIRPGIKFKALSRDIMTKPSNSKVDLNYFSMGLGIAKIF